MVEFTEMKQSLNSLIGTSINRIPSQNLKYYPRREIDEATYELSFPRPDACSYALVVRKSDLIITSWRYLQDPPPGGCMFQSVKQLT